MFGLADHERALTLFVDLPDKKVCDNNEWADRRRIAAEWYTILSENMRKLPFTAAMLCTYGNVGTNNNDLPRSVVLAADTSMESSRVTGEPVLLESVLQASSIVLAPTELSATAPLKNLARKFPFRGATLPGFSRKMIPALSLNYERIHERVIQLKSRLDAAESAGVTLEVEGKQFISVFDLRYRSAHASGGLIREVGLVANLPSGEAYIVPYEGEKVGDPSRTSGLLPVQFGEEIVVYRLENNSAVQVISSGTVSDQERAKLQDEPAYGNIAELGLGVLDEWGVAATGSILLDEKLGLHIAFGRSEHFGGMTGPGAFRSSENVIHVDRVYVQSCQPRVKVNQVLLTYEDGKKEVIIENDEYCI